MSRHNVTRVPIGVRSPDESGEKVENNVREINWKKRKTKDEKDAF